MTQQKRFLNLRLGKKAARPEAVKFKLAQFVDFSKLPKPPLHFGHETVIAPKDWGMLGNDDFGDCVWAGAAHETMLWNSGGYGSFVGFLSQNVLSDYSAVTGFDPSDPNTDNGTDMSDAASYRRKTGIVDSNGTRHKIAAYLSIKPGDIKELYVALYLFHAVGVGIEFPSSAFDQFNRAKPWSVVRNSSIEGGHYIPMVAKRKSMQCVTWGQLQGMTVGFYQKYNDETIAYVSQEMLINNKSPEGFDSEGLLSALNQLK